MKAFAEMPAKTPRPPAELSPDSAALWRRLQRQYQIADEAGLLLLTTAMLSRDRAARASALIEQHGEVVTDRFGQLRANPACSVERDARAAMLAALRSLHLEVPAGA